MIRTAVLAALLLTFGGCSLLLKPSDNVLVVAQLTTPEITPLAQPVGYDPTGTGRIGIQ